MFMAKVLLLTRQCCLESTHGAARSVRAMLEVLARRGDVCQSLGVTAPGDSFDALWRVPGSDQAPAQPTPLRRVELAGVEHWRVAVAVAHPLSSADAAAFMACCHALVQRLRPDLVICHGEPWLDPVLSAARATGTRVLAYLADPNRLRPEWVALSPYDGWLSPSHAMAQQCQDRFGVMPQVCRSLVTASLDGATNLQSERLASRAERTVTLVNPEPNKGGLFFLTLAAHMLRQAPGVKFLAVEGRWGRAQWLAAGVDVDALTNLSWQPSTPDMGPVYARTALLLVPSLGFEVSGRVVAEALLSGVPVLATRSGGVEEQLNGGGFLFDIPASMQSNFMATPQPAEMQPWLHYICTLMLGREALYTQAVELALQASVVYQPAATVPALYAVVDKVLGVSARAALQVESTQAVPGFLYGLAQPSLRVRLRFLPSGNDDALARRFLSAVEPFLPATEKHDLQALAPLAAAVPPLLAALAAVVHRLQAAAGLTVVPLARLLESAGGRHLLALPGPIPSVVADALTWAVQALDALAGDPLAAALPETLLNERDLLQARFARLAPEGTNTRHLLRVAYAMGIPVLALPGGVFQYGWGCRARLFKSTITDGTSAIGTAWAKNKHQTNALLRMAGLPVPEQAVVATLEAAVAAALRIGYPVVLKPANLEQGTGVEAGLRNEAELRVAHTRSSRYAKTLLLEKHVPGDDYRVLVVQGVALSASHRIPARVVGDGVRCVAELVAAANRERQPAGGAPTLYKPIELDAEALELLAREGLDLQSVVSPGRVLTLRRTANSSRGGSAVDVTHQMHPDNAALCVQAAALLRLDMAGLDLLITDISRSWREVGGAFCEVNAQPQTGGVHPWIFEKILKRYVTGQGRIPTVLVLAPPGESPLAREIVAALEQSGLRTGLLQGSGEALLRDCRAKLMVPDLAALVVVTDCKELLRWGLPLDRFDLLLVDGWPAPEPERDGLLALLAPQVNRVLLPMAAPDTARLQQHWRTDQLQQLESASALVPALLQALKDLPDGG
jgi:cyanophycin synthetase